MTLLVAVHAFLSWPAHVPWYANTWSLEGQSLRPALRLQPEDEYLTSRLGAGYQMVRLIERATPPGSTIYAFDVPPFAYCTREILPYYYSALNSRLRECLVTVLDGSMQPGQALTFRINPQRLRAMRLFETSTTRPTTPGVTELRIFGPSAELQANPTWRLDAHPFPWDVALAFDHNPVTRWKAWEEVRKGAWVQVDFGAEQTVSAVRLETTPDQHFVQWELQGKTASGKWTDLRATSESALVRGPFDLRKAATDELKHNNIQYILVDSPYVEKEFRDHIELWGIRLIGAVPGQELYKIPE